MPKESSAATTERVLHRSGNKRTSGLATILLGSRLLYEDRLNDLGIA